MLSSDDNNNDNNDNNNNARDLECPEIPLDPIDRHPAHLQKRSSSVQAADVSGGPLIGHSGGKPATLKNNNQQATPSLPRFLNGDQDGFTRLYDSISLSSGEREYIAALSDGRTDRDLLVDNTSGDRIEMGPVLGGPGTAQQPPPRAIVRNQR